MFLLPCLVSTITFHVSMRNKILFRIMPMSDAESSEGPKTMCNQQRSSASSLTHRHFSSFSESSDDVKQCRWWDLKSLCNLTLRNVVFKVFHNLFTHSFTDLRAVVYKSCGLKGFLSLQNGLSVWFTRLHNHGEDCWSDSCPEDNHWHPSQGG